MTSPYQLVPIDPAADDTLVVTPLITAPNVVSPSGTILRTADGAFIPADPSNTDYQAYLDWLGAGNTPDPAPPPPPPIQIPIAEFLDKFTAAEMMAIQTAAQTNAQIAMGLTMGLARGVIMYANPNLNIWINAITVANCITKARAIEIKASLGLPT